MAIITGVKVPKVDTEKKPEKGVTQSLDDIARKKMKMSLCGAEAESVIPLIYMSQALPKLSPGLHTLNGDKHQLSMDSSRQTIGKTLNREREQPMLSPLLASSGKLVNREREQPMLSPLLASSGKLVNKELMIASSTEQALVSDPFSSQKITGKTDIAHHALLHKTDAPDNEVNRVMPALEKDVVLPDQEKSLFQLTGSEQHRVQSVVHQRIDPHLKDIEASRQHSNPMPLRPESTYVHEVDTLRSPRLTYSFNDWGKGHQVEVQLGTNNLDPAVLHPSDNLVEQRLADHRGQHRQGHPEWVFPEEQEAREDRKKQFNQDEDLA